MRFTERRFLSFWAFFLNRDHLRRFRVQLSNGELDGKPVASDLTNNPLADGRLRLKLGPSRKGSDFVRWARFRSYALAESVRQPGRALPDRSRGGAKAPWEGSHDWLPGYLRRENPARLPRAPALAAGAASEADVPLDVVAPSGTQFLFCEPHLSGQQERHQTNLADTK